jgi:molybdate transport system regulatory protein
MSRCTVRCKVWLEIDGQPLIGTGRERLLLAIDATGSINAAARELGIAYRKAWAQLQEMERIAPFPLFTRRTGGNGGGATTLTPEARQLLDEYRRLDGEVRTLTANCPLPDLMDPKES